MKDILRKAFKPIATAAIVLIGLGAATLFSDSKTWEDIFRIRVDPPVGPTWVPEEFKTDQVVVLHEAELRQLRWMTVSQLKAMFEGRRKGIRVDISPAALQELRWMSTAQIEAIFGTDAPITSP